MEHASDGMPESGGSKVGTPEPLDNELLRALVAAAVLGRSFREIGNDHDLSAVEVEDAVLGWLHQWVPATREEAVSHERERIEGLIRLADHLFDRRSLSSHASKQVLREQRRLRRYLDELTSPRREFEWFEDPVASINGPQPDWADPDFQRVFIDTLLELRVPESEAEIRAMIAEIVKNTAEDGDRRLEFGDQKRAELVPQLQSLGRKEAQFRRSLTSNGQNVATLGGLVEIAGHRLEILELVDPPGR